MPSAEDGAEALVAVGLWPHGIEVLIFPDCGVRGREKLVLPLGLVDHVTLSSAGPGTGDMIRPMFASLALRIEFVAWRLLLGFVRGGVVVPMIVTDLERLPWMKLPSKEDRSIMGSPLLEMGLSGDSWRRLRLEDGESPSGFSRTSCDAFEDEIVYVFVVGVEGVPLS